MTDDYNNKRKKKRGRKNNFSCSCFPSLITPTDHNINNSLDNDNDADITKNGRVLIPVDNDRVVRKQSSHRSHIPRLVKAVLFGSLMAKKIHRSSSSKSSSMASSDTSGCGSYLTYDKTGDDNNTCVKECNDTDETISRCRSNLLTSSSSSSTNCSSNSYTTSSCSTSTFSTSRSSSQQKSSSSSSSQIDLVDFKHPNISSKSFLLDQKVSSRLMDHPRHHLRHQDSSVSVSLPLSNPKPMKKSIHKSLSFQKGISQLDSLLDSSSFPSLTNLNRDKIRNNNNNGNNILWCFFLFLSLVVLVVYGRIFSILCTSTWFYFVPCLRIKRVNSSTNMTAFVDTDSEQYKKRVIMAGLLDRTRNPFR